MQWVCGIKRALVMFTIAPTENKEKKIKEKATSFKH